VADPALARLDDSPALLDDFGGAASTTWRRSFDSALAAATDLGGAPGPPSLCVYMYVCVCMYVRWPVAPSPAPAAANLVVVACGGGGVVAHVPSLSLCVCVACSCGGVRRWWR
jgi:hypothetical protein